MDRNDFTPKNSLDEYLIANPFNIEIYNYLCSYPDIEIDFEPYDYFNLLYETLEDVNANKDFPEQVFLNLSNIKLSELKWYYFMDDFLKLLKIIAKLDLALEPKNIKLGVNYNYINQHHEMEMRRYYSEVYNQEIEPNYLKESLELYNQDEVLDNRVQSKKTGAEQPEDNLSLENDFLLSTIEDHLSTFKENMHINDYTSLTAALKQFFETGVFPTMNKQIKIIGKLDKKRFGWVLNQIYRSERNDHLPKEYLLFAKNNISLFADVEYDESNFLKCNLYKYFTTKPLNVRGST